MIEVSGNDIIKLVICSVCGVYVKLGANMEKESNSKLYSSLKIVNCIERLKKVN